jgi:hypothetical protein
MNVNALDKEKGRGSGILGVLQSKKFSAATTVASTRRPRSADGGPSVS